MTPPRVLVFRNGQVGNTLAAVPLLRALRRHGPESRIDVVVDAVSGDVLRHCPYVNERIQYDRRAADPGLAEHRRLVGRLRAGRYDAALLCKRFFRNELLATLSGAPRRIGFRTPGRRPFRLTDAVPYREGVPVVDLLLDLLRPLGVPPAGRELEAWWSEADAQRLEALAREAAFRLDAPFLVFHTRGATQRENLVPAPFFAAAARELAARGSAAVFLFGPGEEDAAAALRPALPRGSLVLSGEPIGVATRALSLSRGFLGHDSGPAHLSAAVGVPGVVIYADEPGWEAHLAKWTPPGNTVRPLPRSEADPARLTSEAAGLLERSA